MVIGYPTADEAAYPIGFCRVVVEAVKEATSRINDTIGELSFSFSEGFSGKDAVLTEAVAQLVGASRP